MSSEPRTPAVASRLPRVGTTIFTVMSALAQQHGAVNLGQGFPDFDCDPRLVDAVTRAMRAGFNQYPPMAGVPALREAIAAKIEALYGRRYDGGDEITVTTGPTRAILTARLAPVHACDGGCSFSAGAIHVTAGRSPALTSARNVDSLRTSAHCTGS